jgi:hypothetical protein
LKQTKGKKYMKKMTYRERLDALIEIEEKISELKCDGGTFEGFDFCGAWCNNWVLKSMLERPTYANAINHMKSMIEAKIEMKGCGDKIREEFGEEFVQKMEDLGILL